MGKTRRFRFFYRDSPRAKLTFRFCEYATTEKSTTRLIRARPCFYSSHGSLTSSAIYASDCSLVFPGDISSRTSEKEYQGVSLNFVNSGSKLRRNQSRRWRGWLPHNYRIRSPRRKPVFDRPSGTLHRPPCFADSNASRGGT